MVCNVLNNFPRPEVQIGCFSGSATVSRKPGQNGQDGPQRAAGTLPFGLGASLFQN